MRLSSQLLRGRLGIVEAGDSGSESDSDARARRPGGPGSDRRPASESVTA